MSVSEQELKDRATGPRVTMEYLESQIASEHYFNPEIPGPGTLTFCVLVLQNGFSVTGESACADPANYKKDIGERLARANAINKIWPLLGYELRTQLHLAEQSTFLTRMEAEFASLEERATKLKEFMDQAAFMRLGTPDQADLRSQLNVMREYQAILARRLYRAGR
jgi:hypothetical protein